MQLTHPQATLLAHTLHEIRPDWGIPSLMTLLGNHREIPSFGALVIAATTKAMDETCKTPAPIFQPGGHWPEQVRHQVPTGPACEEHTTFPAANCPCCLADVKVGERTLADVGKLRPPA